MDTFQSVKKRSKSEQTTKEYTKKLKRACKKVEEYGKDSITSDSEDDEGDAPFRLEDVDDALFMKFFEKEAKNCKTDRWKAASTVDGYRSALVYYFESNKLPVPDILRGDVLEFIKGLKRVIAEARRNGTYKETEGMDCLDFCAFSHVCKLTSSTTNADAHAFLLLTWNLICRADTTTHLIYGCITWANDALRVDIPKSKGLQRGADRGLAHQESVYANPVQPEVCAITALAIKVLCTPMLPVEGLLYRPSEQQKFASFLDTVLATGEEEHPELYCYNKNSSMYGTQSLRKGSLSLVLSFPGVASAMAALIRAGYSLGQILPKYVQQMLRGDQSVGRTISGLDPHSSDIGLLPPRFASHADLPLAEMIADYPRASSWHCPSWLHPLSTTAAGLPVLCRVPILSSALDSGLAIGTSVWQSACSLPVICRVLSPTCAPPAPPVSLLSCVAWARWKKRSTHLRPTASRCSSSLSLSLSLSRKLRIRLWQLLLLVQLAVLQCRSKTPSPSSWER